jgi:scyllo-inositol 2-dehydrogenase (NADP+)
MTSVKQVALVGYGLGGGTFHAPLLSATPGLRLAAVVTRDEGRRRAVSERYPDARVVASTDDLAALRPAIDLLVISSPSGTHARLARAGLTAGMHVVVDKPFAATAAEVREIASIADRAGRLAIPFQNRRWDGDFLTVQRLLREGAVGDVMRFESRFERWRTVPKPRWCEPDPRANAEGIVHDIGSHLIDQALVLFGPVREVYAEVARRRPGLQVEDEAFVSLLHENGIRSQLHMSASARASGPRMTLLGTRGGYVKNGLDPQEARLGAGGDPRAPDWGEEDAEAWGTLASEGSVTPVRTEPGRYPAFYAAVERAIRSGAPVPVSVDQAVAALEVIEAVFEADQQGRRIVL